MAGKLFASEYARIFFNHRHFFSFRSVSLMIYGFEIFAIQLDAHMIISLGSYSDFEDYCAFLIKIHDQAEYQNFCPIGDEH